MSDLLLRDASRPVLPSLWQGVQRGQLLRVCALQVGDAQCRSMYPQGETETVSSV